MNTQTDDQNILGVSREQQYRTVGELIDRAQPNNTFNLLLILSAIIVAGGILTNNLPIIIGGMLVAPLLTPILVVALALTVGKIELMRETTQLLLKSIGIVVGGSFVLGLLFGQDVVFPEVVTSMTATFLYFIIAIASGIAATYAWINKEASEALPGVAIVVSLVPPLAWVGVAIARLNGQMAITFAIIFILNLIGIILGSLGVFSMSQFARVHKAVDRKHEQVKEKKKTEELVKKIEKEEKDIQELKSQIEKAAHQTEASNE